MHFLTSELFHNFHGELSTTCLLVAPLPVGVHNRRKSFPVVVTIIAVVVATAVAIAAAVAVAIAAAVVAVAVVTAAPVATIFVTQCRLQPASAM